MNPLQQLEACGQAPWLDYLKRSFVAKGDLKAMVENDGLKGVTSNPSIFQKAIGESEEYSEALGDFLKSSDHSISDIYEHLAIADIQAAADVLRPVYDRTKGRDGYVSLECSPYLANDTQATITEAHHLWGSVDRKNLMVKVPATPAGVPAVRELIAKGLNLNITLLFSVSAYEEIVEAYISGLEDLLTSGGDVSRVGSVASFFVSRIDGAVDKKLHAMGDKPEAKALLGKVAIANAKIAYTRYLALFSGPRWQKLADAGAQTQRLLWASTSTKDPTYKDTLYADALIGRDTVDTLPPATLDAFRDHGIVTPNAIQSDVEGAKKTLADLASLGISLDDITKELVVDGVQQFADAFDKLFASVASHRRKDLFGETAGQTLNFGSDALAMSYKQMLEEWRSHGKVRKLWTSDPTLWTDKDESKWGGWLHIVEQELDDVASLEAFAKEVKDKAFSDVLLLGMGGSSLGPEVLAETFGPQSGHPRFHMLDSTDPAQIHDIEAAIDIGKTLFIVSSKSGSTLEPNIFMEYFYARAKSVLGDKVGEHFVAVTDPGSGLEKQAKGLQFAHTFFGLPSIGGRYSVLSKFGLVPAAAIGIDIKRLLKAALSMRYSCGPDSPPEENPGVQLGLAMGLAAARFGRDKVTIIASPKIADLGAWLEQLLAESTGKQGLGLIPVAAEPLAAPSAYGTDRFFAYLELEGGADAAQKSAIEALAAAGHPVAMISVKDEWSIGQEFFRWEIAVAVAGSVIGINPFDQPDVEASKLKTRALTDAYEASHNLPSEEPVFRQNGVAVFADPRNAAELGRHNTLEAYLKSHFARVGGGDYVAFLAYIDRTSDHTESLTKIRTVVRDKTHGATCVGFGPRFQHSTGQAYKGGPNTGIFLQITCDDPVDIEIPGHSYSFGVVKAAQASGDLGVLVERGRRAMRIHLKAADTGLAELVSAVQAALA